jgi:DNA polymerase IV (DinB-like DNA polymerase)
MLVDLDYFFAQCEERRNPSIKDKPVVVCVYSGRTQDSGAVSTANYVARKYGVNSGMPIIVAKRKLKDLNAVFLPVDKNFYKQISDNIMNIFRRYSDYFEQVSIDEAYLDVSQKTRRNFQEARKIALTIKKAVLNNEKLTCSIGIGPNKLIAKIAAGTQKPNGLTIIKPEQVRSFLSPLPVRNLVGIGKKTEKKLEKLGIKKIGQLASFDVQRLIEVFGKKLGIYFYKASLGIDDEKVQERGLPESISRISTIKEDTRNLSVIMNEAVRLCDAVHSRLISKGLFYRSISIYVVAKNLSVHSRSKTLENPSNNLEKFKEKIKELFEKFLAESDLEIRRVGVKLSSLTQKKDQQKDITSFFGNSS